MSIVHKKINNTTYVYSVKSYRKNKKVKTKWKLLGKLDDNGELVMSKKNRKKAMNNSDLPAELILKTVTKKYIVRSKTKSN